MRKGPLDNFVAALAVAASRSVKLRAVAFPIDHLTIDTSVQIGRVSFTVLGRDLFDRMARGIERAAEVNPQTQVPEEALTELRRQYQGFTIAVAKVIAEPVRAVEIAVEAVDEALLPLRFYSPAGVLFESPCYLGRRGRVLIPALNYIELSDDLGTIMQIADAFEESRDTHITFDDDHLRIIEPGFSALCRIIGKDRRVRTAMEERVLRAIDIFNSGMRVSSLSERIVADLASLETLFLRNENEPIQSSLSRRVAFVTRAQLDQRKSVMRSIKRGYTLRSRYLHHGLSTDQAGLLAIVHRIAWEGLNTMVANVSRYADPRDLVEAIDDRMLAAH